MLSNLDENGLKELIASIRTLQQYRHVPDVDVLTKLLSKVPGAELVDHLASGKPLRILVDDPEATCLTIEVMDYLIRKDRGCRLKCHGRTIDA